MPELDLGKITGEPGANGVGITSIKQTTTSGVDGGSNVFTVTLDNGATGTLTVKNGSKGSEGDPGAAATINGVNALLLEAAKNIIMEQTGSTLTLGAKDKKTARFVVGTSTNGWTELDCDYLCDGVSDDVEINAAIAALPASGGEVVLLDGTYALAAPITVNKAYTTLRGNGKATQLVRGFEGTSDKTGSMIYVSAGYCTIADLYLSGKKDTYTSNYCYGVYNNSGGNYGTLRNVIIREQAGGGAYILGEYSKVIGCWFEGNEGYGVGSGAHNQLFLGNTCLNNGTYGIFSAGNGSKIFLGNHCKSNGKCGIYTFGAFTYGKLCVIGNLCEANGEANIRIASSYYGLIVGNHCGVFSGGTTTYSLHLEGTSNKYNLIADNYLGGVNYVDGGGTGNVFVNNFYDSSLAPTTE